MKRLLPSLFLATLASLSTQAQAPKWPAITQQTKPWTRWWWEGSAVNKADLTHLLTQYQQAGLGGMEITTIYGVKGAESQFIDFLSPKWMDMLTHTLTEATRLGLGIDMAQASGWPFGGPWVAPVDASKYVAYSTYSVKGGESLPEPVSFMQKPIANAVGHKVDLKQLSDPVATNKNLQTLALDQVRFEKPLPLQTLMAYSDKGQTLDLTSKVGADGKLSWTAPTGTWTLYALFQGWHGKQVERAGPGGEGDVIDHLSKTATDHYLAYFDKAFKGYDVKPIRAFFNDSYEVDDAQGEANWTPLMFAEFQKRRGYDLRQHLPALFNKAAEDENKRVLTDYRETISELLLENYTKTWGAWAKTHDALIRNQAHGSPANILDLYAATDIPETEGEDLTRIKFASSAAHVTGKPLTSAETATWENDHFLSKLSDVKKAVDRMLLGGVNHVFYHGTAYSPQAAKWPGWLFYAAVEFNPQNPFWTDFGKLNQYAARCQSFLQAGQPSNDVLLYLPISDAYTRPGKVLLQHFDGIEHGFKGMPIEATSEMLLAKGYGYDFISDKQVQQVVNAGKGLTTSGGATYQTLLVPEAHLMPLPTLQQLLKLAQNGATIVLQSQAPDDVPGLGSLATRRAAFKKLLAQLNFAATKQAGVQQATVGKGRVLLGKDVSQLLAQAGVKRETLVDNGLQFMRRSHAKGHYYFLANWGEKAIKGWVPLHTAAKSAALYNPMTEQTGMASVRTSAQGTPEVYLQLAPGETCILDTNEGPVTGPAYTYLTPAAAAQPLTGPWDLAFLSGGPELPARLQTRELASWTTLAGEAGKKFSGTATYTTTFAMPQGTSDGWLLDLGRVAQSARVLVNGQPMGTLIGPVYQVFLPKSRLQPTNTLTVTVSNLMANRIADLDRNHVDWKIFYNTNMPAKLKENRSADGLFTAEKWEPLESGLLGPVTLTPASLGAPVQ
ncbi:glycoside hydrolase family 2 protein [Hymenobacter sedentarius]|uniref:Glycoside hydrolase family 2 protein n=1 Tax=Hymenobacter sedentarius TaxID=1411621 RepID=A0A0U3SXI5_9BACT|nr:glycosyl hydrolase [Hymenobacter sedentarius]ALW85267.1 glycoside hydrolase family 2 protein [Hymenobacter sedentarius]